MKCKRIQRQTPKNTHPDIQSSTSKAPVCFQTQTKALDVAGVTQQSVISWLLLEAVAKKKWKKKIIFYVSGSMLEWKVQWWSPAVVIIIDSGRKNSMIRHPSLNWSLSSGQIPKQRLTKHKKWEINWFWQDFTGQLAQLFGNRNIMHDFIFNTWVKSSQN